MNKNIVFFDGHCNLCNKTVDWLIRIDKKQVLFFSPLSGKTAIELEVVDKNKRAETDFSSIVFYKNDKEVFESSDAIIEILYEVLPYGRVAYILKVIPKVMRDLLYRLISKSRYSLFGKSQTCRLPSLEEKERFLD